MVSPSSRRASSHLIIRSLPLAFHPHSFFLSLGLNPRAPIIYLLALFPSLPGFISNIAVARSMGPPLVPQGWVHTSYLAWPLGFTIAATGWVVINKVFAPPGAGEMDETDVYGTFDVVEGEGSEVEKGSMAGEGMGVVGLGRERSGSEGGSEGEEISKGK